MPPNVLVVAKVIVLTLLLRGYLAKLPETFLPFVRALDAVPPPVFRSSLQVMFGVSACLLLLNIRVRTTSAFAGGALILGLLGSRVFYSNNLVFCALLLLLCALSQRGRSPAILRWQVALVFLGAGLDKLLQPAWRSGRFMALWIGDGQHPSLTKMAAVVPSLPSAELLSWMTIGGELGIGILLLVPALYPFAIAGVLLFECALFTQSGQTYGMFYFAATASMILFMRWPEETLSVIYDGDCGICNGTRRWFERIDFNGQFAWHAYQSGTGEQLGISIAEARKNLHVVGRDRIISGFRAFRAMLQFNSGLYILLYALLALRGEGRLYIVAPVAMLLLSTPPAAAFGELVYQRVARNRHGFLTEDSCRVP